MGVYPGDRCQRLLRTPWRTSSHYNQVGTDVGSGQARHFHHAVVHEGVIYEIIRCNSRLAGENVHSEEASSTELPPLLLKSRIVLLLKSVRLS